MRLTLFLAIFFCACAGLHRAGPPQPPRTSGTAALRSVRVVFFGDLRPHCRPEEKVETERREASIRQVVRAIKATDPDLVVVNGDYGCAWSDEPVVARKHYGRLKKLLREEAGGDVFARFHFTQGNHDVAHPDLVRVYFGDEPRWSVTVRGVRVVAAPSDYAWGRGAGAAADNRAWLRQAMAPAKGVAVTIFVRHEPWNVHSPRGDARFDEEVRPIVEAAQPALLIFSHEHTYRRVGPRALISGNGGAPGWDSPSAAGFVGFVQVDTVPSVYHLRVTSFEAFPDGGRIARDTFEVAIP